MAKYKGYDYAKWSKENESFNWNITPRLEYVDVNTLFTFPKFQRDLEEDRASGMAAFFLPMCADGVRIAELPDGRRFIVDGQHRIRAAQLAGQPGVWALVYGVPTYAQAAAMFFNVNGDGVVKTTPQAALNAANESEHPRAQKMWDILGNFDLTLDPKKAAAEAKTLIQAVHVVERIYDADDGDLLALTIEVITESWGVDYYKVNGKRNRIPVLSDSVLEGIALFLAHHPQVAYRPFLLRELKRNLGKVDLGSLMEKANASWVSTNHKPKLSFHVEREVLDAFNHNRSATGNRQPDRTARDFLKLGDLGKLRRTVASDEEQEGA